MIEPGGMSFVTVSALVTVGAVVATLALWNRGRAARAVRGLRRIGLLLVCQVTAVVLVFGVVNHANGFYTSWDDLLGQHDAPSIEAGATVPGAGTTSPAGSASADASAQPGTPGTQTTTAVVDPAVFTPGDAGTMAAHVVGTASGVHGDVFVWTPPGYDPATPGGYPVLLALGGHPGDAIDAINGLQLEQAVTAAMQAGTMRPTIVVAATTNIQGRDRGCADVPGGDQVATWLTTDVPGLVGASFDIATAAPRWSVMGLSSGGYCAVRLAATHPALFAAAVSIAGNNLPDAADLQDTPEHRQANDLRTLIAASHTPAVAVLAAVSLKDTSTAKDGRLLQAAANAGVSVDLESVPKGGHNWDVWASMVPAALTWLAPHQVA